MVRSKDTLLSSLITEDFPFLEIERIVDIESLEENIITAKIIAKNKMVYNLYIDKDTVRPTIQRFI